MKMTDILGRSDKRKAPGRSESYLHATSTLRLNQQHDLTASETRCGRLEVGRIGSLEQMHARYEQG